MSRNEEVKGQTNGKGYHGHKENQNGMLFEVKVKGETIKKMWPMMPTNQQVFVCVRRHHAMAYMIKRIMTNLSEGSNKK